MSLGYNGWELYCAFAQCCVVQVSEQNYSDVFDTGGVCVSFTHSYSAGHVEGVFEEPMRFTAVSHFPRICFCYQNLVR